MKHLALVLGALALTACASAPLPQAKCAIHVGNEWNQVECSTIDLHIKADHLINGPLDD